MALWAWMMAWSASAAAFDYLEHSFFTDRACLEVQRRLAPALERGGPALTARYLALALACPARWDRPYCSDDNKRLTGHLHLVEEDPLTSGDLSATLGDLSALPDHLSRYGPARGFERATDDGLLREVLTWLTMAPDTPGGVIEDVAEDACETDDLVPWARVEQDVTAGLREVERLGRLPDIPARLLSPALRAPIPRGPNDPAGAYSFDNPHYLDLTLRNHHHFGARAYASWRGFHDAALIIAQRGCGQTLALDDDALEDLADDLPGWDEVDWEEMTPEAMRKAGCGMLADAARHHLLRWARDAEPWMVAPVAGVLDALARQPDAPSSRALLDATVAALMGLVFEGSGLHFLQDNLAAGHVRTDRAAWDLADARYWHDTDNRLGVAVDLGTRVGRGHMVAFGDSFLMGPAQPRPERCDWEAMDQGDPEPEVLSACLIAHQRTALVAVTTASLLDWVWGGLHPAQAQSHDVQQPPPRGCPEDELDAQSPDARRNPLSFVCRFMPTRPVALAALAPPDPPPDVLAFGELPVPPPPFVYESMLVPLGADATGKALQSGLRLEFLSALGTEAQWLTSYHVGLLNAQRADGPDTLSLEFAYAFHWRWAARFLINMAPFVHGGLRGIGGDKVSAYAGVGPQVGITALPEGWTRIPLELSLNYRVPITLLDERFGLGTRAFGIEAHWIELGIGLAFF